ncbi:MAG: ABC transporter substrate-binding protein [Candidatus Vogelbacteria bacterium]|nr:ABC transporter substrate-binding protein [Candidatus Vogelbacteria bacterium]
MKWIIAIIVIILIIAGIWFYGSKPVVPAGEKQTIKIGVSIPLTGNLAFLGTNYQQAVNLALSELSSSTNKYNYQVVFEDDKFDPATGATTANKLVGIDKVNVLMSFGSPVGNVFSPIAEQNKIIHLNAFASDPNVAKGNYNFIHYTPPYEEAKLMVAELQKKGIKKVALFEQNQPGVAAATAAIRKSIQGTDITLVDQEKFNTGDRDFRSSIVKTKNSGADIIMIDGTSPELELLVKQIKEAGIKTKLTSIESFEFSDQPQLFEGLWYVNAADQTKAFIDKFTSVYGNAPKLGGGNGYDAINMLVYAYEKAGDGKTIPSADQIVPALLSIQNFDGAMGTLNMGQDHIVNTKAVVRMIKNGVPTTIAE